jgi:hypothetical protein
VSTHRFGDSRRAHTRLVEWFAHLRQLDDADLFAETVLQLLMPFEREKPLRNLIRAEFPNGSFGLVAEDLDLVLRAHGPRKQTDFDGRIRLVETKWNPNTDTPVQLKGGQLYTFRLIDRMLRETTDRHRYQGFYIITHTHFDLAEGRIWWQQLDREPREIAFPQLLQWLSFDPPRQGRVA